MSADAMMQDLRLGPEPSDETKQKARLAICDRAESPEEARMLLEMLDLL